MLQRTTWSMHKPTDSFWRNQRARNGLCHSLPF